MIYWTGCGPHGIIEKGKMAKIHMAEFLRLERGEGITYENEGF